MQETANGLRSCPRISWLVVVLTVFLPVMSSHAGDANIQVLSFNILKNNTESSTGWSISQTEKVNRIVEVVNSTGAGIVGFQEGQNHVNEVFNQLGGASAGWHLVQQGNSGGLWGTRYIMSKYPINKMSENGVGAELQIGANTSAWIFNVHLPYNAYGPYYVRDNPNASQQEILDSTQSTSSTMRFAPNDFEASTKITDAVFLTGDFNDPSHLDWTQEAANAGLHFGKTVPWVTSTLVQDAGFSDSFREIHPDEVNYLGETWSPILIDDVQDRIDFVYYRGSGVTPTESHVVGEVGAPPHANVDVPIVNYPSDHRAVVSSFTVAPFLFGDLDGDGDLDAADWTKLRAGQHTDLMGLTPQQAYAMGDLNADLLNNHEDFVLFKITFDYTNGTGSFSTMVASVPEPSSLLLVALASFALVARTRVSLVEMHSSHNIESNP